jgi:hypothetical protein
LQAAIDNLGIFYDRLVYFKAVGNIDGHLVYFMVIWENFPHFVVLFEEKSGNTARDHFFAKGGHVIIFCETDGVL